MRFNSVTITILLFALPLLLLSASKGPIVVNQGDIITDDFYGAGAKAENFGKIFGDFVVMAKDVVNEGQVLGDVIGIGQKVELLGACGEDARLIGQTVTVMGRVSDDLMIIGQDVHIIKSTVVGGNVLIKAKNVRLEGNIRKDVKINATEVILGGNFDGSIRINAENIKLLANTRIKGNFEYPSEAKVDAEPGAYVAGKTIPASESHRSGSWFKVSSRLTPFLLYLAGFTLLSILCALLLPCKSQHAASTLETHPVYSAIAGVLWLVCVPIVVVVFLYTVVGVFVAGVLLSLYVLSLLLSGIPVALIVGKNLLRKVLHPVLYVMTGMLLLVLCSYIPKLGIYIPFLVIVLGTGSALLSLSKYR